MMESRQEEFEDWLIDMDNELERLNGFVPADIRHKLDYSAESLVVIEDWILQRYKEVTQIKEPQEAIILDGLVRYVGETFRKHLGAKWKLQIENPEKVYYELPVLIGGKLGQVPIGVHSLVISSIDRRTGTYLKRLFERKLNGL